MYRSNRLAMLMSVAVLVASAVLLSGCRLGCSQGDIHCQTGISPTYTVPVPPTPTTLPPITDPKQLATAFVTIYSGDSGQYVTLAPLFDTSYSKISPTAIACAALNTRENYGTINTSTVHDPVITGTVALIVVDVSSVSRSGPENFMLKQEGAAGWKIDSIIGWIGGDITPDTPVGASESCLTTAPADTGGTAGSGTPGATTPGTGGADTPTPLPLDWKKSGSTKPPAGGWGRISPHYYAEVTGQRAADHSLIRPADRTHSALSNFEILPQPPLGALPLAFLPPPTHNRTAFQTRLITQH